MVSDVSSIHNSCVLFFDKLDTTIVVYLHGSFARGLETDESDVNLYIPSHSRVSLAKIWAGLYMRKPTYEDPSIGESIENHLRDVLGREVCICCSDDPWLWVKRDVLGEIYPNLDKHFQIRNLSISDSTSRSLNVIRKCWYHVRYLEIEEKREQTLWSDNKGTPSACSSADSTAAANSYQYSRRYVTMVATNELLYLLGSLESCDLETIPLDSRAVTQLVEELEPQESAVYRFLYMRDDEDSCWDSLVERYHRFATAILNSEEIVFPA
jgi:hypothetical protein